jgi:hypothetical protein
VPNDMTFLGISLRFDDREVYVESDEPSRFAHRFAGEVLRLNDDYRDDTIGWFKAVYVDVESAIDDGEDIYTVFDATGQSELEYFNALYKPDGDVRAAVQKLIYGDPAGWWAPNLLILDRLELLPAHRGVGAGLVTLWGLMRVLGIGAGVVAIKPFPLQVHGRPTDPQGMAHWDTMQFESLPKDQRRATAALRRYYGLLGFKRLLRTPYMVRDARQKLPALSCLIRPPGPRTVQQPE